MDRPLDGEVTNGLSGTLKLGLIFIGAIALASAVSTLALIGFISYRASKWNNFYTKDIRRNVFVVLLCNLFLADFFQSFGFLFSWHWYGMHDIISNTAPCTVQGFFINFGDVASAFFVLAIAGQTWSHLRFQRQLRFDAFVAIVVCIWIFAVVLTVLGPVTTNRYFVDTGAWCWVDSSYKSQRLAYHYFWIFLVEFGTVIVYGFVIWELRRSSKKLHIQNEVPFEQAADTHRRIRKSCLIMLCYPISYITLTLPLAVSRMYEVRGVETSIPYRIFCGCFLVSSGWVDTLLYVLTRASFLKSQDTCRARGDNDQRRNPVRNTPTPQLKHPSRVHQASPARSTVTPSRSTVTPSRSSASPTGEPTRMMSMSSWRSDTKTLSNSRAEEPFSPFDHELASPIVRTLTLDAKIHGAH